MFYENEMKLLCETFKRSRVPVSIISPDSDVVSLFPDEVEALPDKLFIENIISGELWKKTKANTLYKIADRLGLCYIFFLLPETATNTLIIIGPYTHSALEDGQVLEIGERHGFSPHNLRLIEEYCAAIPIIAESSHLFIMLDCFCEHIWKQEFEVIDLQRQDSISYSPLKNELGAEQSNILLDMKNMERRYRLENDIMDAVAHGQIHKLNRIFTGFSERSFEKRTSDPLRNIKNYCIIMNTLLRKAAERGGVHPMYIDRVSSRFAIEIEHLPSTSEASSLMTAMFTEYCELVRGRSTENYPPIVAETLLMIDSDISAELTLSSLAEKLSISSVYLSTLFKKAVGKTLTEYLREKRMNHAAYLLKTTNLQVQTVAMHCGIDDLQYFSKQFKRHTGKTPKEYRESVQR